MCCFRFSFLIKLVIFNKRGKRNHELADIHVGPLGGAHTAESVNMFTKMSGSSSACDIVFFHVNVDDVFPLHDIVLPKMACDGPIFKGLCGKPKTTKR